MACNDTAGLKLTAACRDLGLQVPRDVAVIGVDDEDVVCELSSSLSSIPCDCERIGYEAAAALDRLMEGRRVGGPVFVPPRPPVIRASSDTVACVDPLVAQAGRRLGVRDILARVPASRRTLEVRFRRELGTTMHAEIVRARIDRAKRLLGETDMPVKAVAVACGFGAPQRFHPVFRAETGAAPIAWRRRSRGPRR
jgi:LacI family transcriptional regulator